jgi:hypothetical protein
MLTPMDLQTGYQILGLDGQADDAQARRAYKDQVRRWHPDRFPEGSAAKSAAEERLKQINIAYAQIKAHWAAVRAPSSTGGAAPAPDPQPDARHRTERPTEKSPTRAWVDHLLGMLNTLAGDRPGRPPAPATGHGEAGRSGSFHQILAEIAGADIPPPKKRRPVCATISGQDSGATRRCRGSSVAALGGTEQAGPVKPIGRVRGIGRSR